MSDVREHLQAMADILKRLDRGAEPSPLPEEFLLHFQEIVRERVGIGGEEFLKARHELGNAIAVSGASRPAQLPRLMNAFSSFREVIERPSQQPTKLPPTGST